jgi:hypothetical protein
MTQEQNKQHNSPNSSQAPLPEEIDKTPPSKDAPGYDLPPGQSAIEAARIGQEDQSENVGANIAAKQDHMAAGMPPSAGDPDVMQEQAKVVGEEAIGGTTPTPDQDNVDEVAAAVGINTQAEHPVRVTREMQRRDEQRYELDPESKGPASSA